MEIINKYLEYIQNVKKLSYNTIIGYERDIKKYMEWADGAKVDYTTAKPKDIKNFVAKAFAGKSASTTNRAMSSIKEFYNYLVMEELVSVNPVSAIDRAKQPQKVIDIITVDEKNAILKAAADPNNSENFKMYFRDYAIMNLLFSTGMRRDELVNLKVSDVDLCNNAVLISKGKGNKERVTYYNDTTRMILAEYINAHRALYETSKNSEYLFVSQKAESLSDRSINNIVNRFMEIAGCKKKGRSVHNTRKRFATDAYIASGDIYAVANILGHSGIGTVARYAQAQGDINKKICMGL